MSSKERILSSDDIQCVDLGRGVIVFFYGYHPDITKEAQILRAAPKMFELLSEMVSAKREEMEAVGKKVRLRHEAEDLLKSISCVPKHKEVAEHEEIH